MIPGEVSRAVLGRGRSASEGLPLFRLFVRKPLHVVVLERFTALRAFDLVPETVVKICANACRHAHEAGRGLVGACLGDGRCRELGHGLGVGADDALAVPAEDIS